MKRVKTLNSSYIILLVISLTILGYLCFKYFVVPQKSEILVINPPSIESGSTTISGILRKDSPVGKIGNYILILDDGSPVVLDVKGLDPLLGIKVSATGILYPATEANPTMSMIVKKITPE